MLPILIGCAFASVIASVSMWTTHRDAVRRRKRMDALFCAASAAAVIGVLRLLRR